MENPFNDSETRADFLKLGYEEPKIKSMYRMFEKIIKGTQQENPHCVQHRKSEHQKVL